MLLEHTKKVAKVFGWKSSSRKKIYWKWLFLGFHCNFSHPSPSSHNHFSNHCFWVQKWTLHGQKPSPVTLAGSICSSSCCIQAGKLNIGALIAEKVAGWRFRQRLPNSQPLSHAFASKFDMRVGLYVGYTREFFWGTLHWRIKKKHWVAEVTPVAEVTGNHCRWQQW